MWDGRSIPRPLSCVLLHQTLTPRTSPSWSHSKHWYTVQLNTTRNVFPWSGTAFRPKLQQLSVNVIGGFRWRDALIGSDLIWFDLALWFSFFAHLRCKKKVLIFLRAFGVRMGRGYAPPSKIVGSAPELCPRMSWILEPHRPGPGF